MLSRSLICIALSSVAPWKIGAVARYRNVWALRLKEWLDSPNGFTTISLTARYTHCYEPNHLKNEQPCGTISDTDRGLRGLSFLVHIQKVQKMDSIQRKEEGTAHLGRN